MPVDPPVLIPYEAFTIEEGNPPAFVIHAHDEAIVFPYAHLHGVGWLKSHGGHQLLVEHRFFSLYLLGNNLEPLREGFARFAVRTVLTKSASDHFASRPSACGVRLAACGQLGGPISILPPEKFRPWQPMQLVAI